MEKVPFDTGCPYAFRYILSSPEIIYDTVYDALGFLFFFLQPRVTQCFLSACIHSYRLCAACVNTGAGMFRPSSKSTAALRLDSWVTLSHTRHPRLLAVPSNEREEGEACSAPSGLHHTCKIKLAKTLLGKLELLSRATIRGQRMGCGKNRACNSIWL